MTSTRTPTTLRLPASIPSRGGRSAGSPAPCGRSSLEPVAKRGPFVSPPRTPPPHQSPARAVDANELLPGQLPINATPATLWVSREVAATAWPGPCCRQVAGTCTRLRDRADVGTRLPRWHRELVDRRWTYPRLDRD